MENTTNLILEKLNSWWELIIKNLPNLAVALLVLIVSYFLSILIYRLLKKAINKRINKKSVTNLIARTGSVLIILIGLFLALSALNLSKSITGLLTGAGISGIIIGLALQESLSNSIAGIILSFRKNIRLGDWIDTNDYSGEVIDITLNYVVLKEADNNIVIIPNKLIKENPFKNYSLTTKMRVVLSCGVGYESELEQVEKITKTTIENHFDQDKIDENVEFYFTEFGDSSINFICRFWIYGKSSLEILKAKSKLIIELHKAFNENEINIPFPIRTLDFQNADFINSEHKNDNK
ncbi:MAG TPA: mechanosensitive ion channel family protein [Flavobacteriaceae bacterium]|nr:mechanosensitive ion channel family protein [Flavobacteriaceae bacterium]